jgi:hypothetical protein
VDFNKMGFEIATSDEGAIGEEHHGVLGHLPFCWEFIREAFRGLGARATDLYCRSEL